MLLIIFVQKLSPYNKSDYIIKWKGPPIKNFFLSYARSQPNSKKFTSFNPVMIPPVKPALILAIKKKKTFPNKWNFKLFNSPLIDFNTVL